ncbi:MAG: glycosyltransferase family 4 protein [Candidatus Omnitrophica bacterium]|nr:glycosyltransferase family 4 protein [Candidatus Omnitrophota bacterium]
MRTLFITEWFCPDIGGSITWYENVYSRYPKGEVFILSKNTKGDKDYDKTTPFFIYRASYKRYPFLRPESLNIYITFLWKAFWIVKKHNIELVHCDKALPSGLIAYYLNKLTGISYISYCHGEEVATYLKHTNVIKKMAAVYNTAAKVIVNSNFTKNLLISIGVKESNLVVIHPGTDADIFRPGIVSLGLREKLGLKNNRILLTVGRLQRRKGHDMVIRSLPELVKKFSDLVYIIIGDGEEMKYLENLAKEQGVGDKVVFAGRVRQEDLPTYFNMCDIFIMANRSMENGDVEGFGIVFLEANACEKPVIGGNSGGVPDAVIDGRTGIIVDGGKEGELVAAISELLSDPIKAHEMGSYGRKWVVENFGWDLIFKKIKALENLLT